MALPVRPAEQPPSSRLEEIISPSDRVQELSDSENEYEDMGTVTEEEQANIAYLDTVMPLIKDKLQTATSKTEDETFRVIEPFLHGNPYGFALNSHGIPELQREAHVDYLVDSLDDYPAQFAMMDASRPWMVYWGLQGLTVLGHDISKHRQK
jgi:protein farnesyltransferase subunit beta